MYNNQWIMTQEWHNILFLHWPVSPDDLIEHIPFELELDLYNGSAWIGLVFFKVKGNRPRLTPPILGFSSFLELNFRTYVTFQGRVGVYFFSLDANNPLIVKLMRMGGFLPFRYAEISLKQSKNTFTVHSRYREGKSVPEVLVTTFKPIPGRIESNLFERWLTERYYLWTKTKDNLFRVYISHSPWVLQNVTCTIFKNSMASFLNSNDNVNGPIAHYSKLKKARFFPPVKENRENK
ncbi:YqjF family protein [Psychrobacillus sp. NPDC058041]|uniref:YqjF family protein n=1 Tax=Psychrobacillus sp. NPDC058041 TaxID=3346310 RepID=UPI0036D9FA6E